MSEGFDFNLEEEVEVEEMLGDGFGEVEFEEIKIGFQDECEEEEHEDLSDEDLKEFLSLGFMADTFGGLNLEDTLSPRDNSGESSDGVALNGERGLTDEDFYKVRDDVGKSYDVKEDNYETEFVSVDDVNVSVGSGDGVRGERSMLEISGFRDEDAERKRKDKEERFW